MSSRTYPAWLARVLPGPDERRFQDPGGLLAPYVRPGMWVLDIGCGAGDFSILMARMLEGRGRVIALDRREDLVRKLGDRLQAEQLFAVVEPRICPAHTLRVGDMPGEIDFALAFDVVHRVTDRERFFHEIRDVLKPGGRVLLAEPGQDVSGEVFEASIACARAAGFSESGRPDVPQLRTAVLEKQGGDSLRQD